MSYSLYKLINNLSTNERAYFKRNSSIHASRKNKNYLKIYEVIEKMKVYDKKALGIHFEGTSIHKYLSTEVNYLKEKILVSLFNFNMNKSKRNHIQKGILMVEVLAGKGLQKEALKKIKTLKRNAIKQEEFTSILRLIELEENILFKQGIIGYKDKLQALHLERSKITLIIQNLNEYHFLRQEAREFQFTEHLFQEDMKELKEFCGNPLVQNIENCLCEKAKEHWYYIKVLVHYLRANFQEGLNVSFEYVNFIISNDHLIDSQKILPAISNYIYHAAIKSEKEHFLLGQKLIIDISTKKEYNEYYIKYILYSRNLEFGYYDNDIRLMREYLPLTLDLVENYIENYEEAQIQYLYSIIIKSAIILQDTDLGVRYSNLWHQRGILNHAKVQARLFSIMLHYDLNYMELIQSEIVLLKKLGNKNYREKVIISTFYNFFNSVIKYPLRKETLLIQFQNELKTITDNNKTLSYFDYYKWSLKLS